MKTTKILIIIIVVLALGIGAFFLLKNKENNGNIPSSRTNSGIVKQSYGTDAKNYYLIKLQNNAKSSGKTKLVILVHGGGFRSGSAEAGNIRTLADYFFEQGYSVASLSYRLCPDVTWPAPIEDIAKGAQAVLDNLKNQKIDVEQTVYAGFSAGANAGAYLFYSSKYPTVTGVDKFISFDGIYSPDSLSKQVEDPLQTCQIQSSAFFGDIFDGKTKTAALLIEGENDPYDTNPKTPKSHLEYLANKLRGQGVLVETYWAKVTNGKCAHECAIDLVGQRDRDIINKITDFLSI